MKEKLKPHVDQNKGIMDDLNYVGSSLSMLFLPSDLESVKLLVFLAQYFCTCFRRNNVILYCYGKYHLWKTLYKIFLA